MLENHNAVTNNPSVQRYLWQIYTNFPFPAHVYLLCALRYRTSDELSDRAWQLLSESAETRMKHDDTQFFAKKKQSLVHLALGNMTIKAWEAREAAFQALPQAPSVPRFVSLYRKQLAEKKSRRQPETNDSPPSQFASMDQPFGSQTASQFSMLDPTSLGMGQAFDQSMLLPTDLPPTDWQFWTDMMQAGDSIQGIDAIPLPYNYYQN